jgi:hypothetical protein
MFRIHMMLLLSLCALVPGLAASKQERGPDLQRDARLTKKLKLPGETVRLQQIVQRLSETTEVDLMVQGDLLRRPLAVAVKDKTAAEVMENLAVLFGGTWLRRGDGYLLITDEVTANLVAAYPPERSTEEEERALFTSITPQQLTQMQQRGPLRFERMTPAQQRLVLAITRDRYLKEPHRFPSSIVTGKGLMIITARAFYDKGDGRPAMPTGSYTIELVGPGFGDDGVLAENIWFAGVGGRR